MGWIILILFIIVVLIVWIALIQNARKYRADFKTGGHEEGLEIEDSSSAEVEEVTTPRTTQIAADLPVETPLKTSLKKPDDLTVIEGIGPKVSKILEDSGIGKFTDLASTDPEKLRAILEKEKLQFLDPATWPEQARLAADGKLEELKELQLKLKAGRKG